MKGKREREKKGEREQKINSLKWDTHDGGFPCAIGPQQSCDLVSVKGESEFLDSHFMIFILLGHRYQSHSWATSFHLSGAILL